MFGTIQASSSSSCFRSAGLKAFTVGPSAPFRTIGAEGVLQLGTLWDGDGRGDDNVATVVRLQQLALQESVVLTHRTDHLCEKNVTSIGIVSFVPRYGKHKYKSFDPCGI